jgi:hypothetical protein
VNTVNKGFGNTAPTNGVPRLSYLLYLLHVAVGIVARDKAFVKAPIFVVNEDRAEVHLHNDIFKVRLNNDTEDNPNSIVRRNKLLCKRDVMQPINITNYNLTTEPVGKIKR